MRLQILAAHSRQQCSSTMSTNGTYSTETPSSAPPAGVVWDLPGVVQYLQSEHSRYERDRNIWELEKADMLAKLARLEGERKAFERLKSWYYRRVKMLETALRYEREFGPGQDPWDRAAANHDNDKVARVSSPPEPRMQPGDVLRDPTARQHSRVFLDRCLSEITYLVSKAGITTDVLCSEAGRVAMSASVSSERELVNSSAPGPLQHSLSGRADGLQQDLDAASALVTGVTSIDAPSEAQQRVDSEGDAHVLSPHSSAPNAPTLSDPEFTIDTGRVSSPEMQEPRSSWSDLSRLSRQLQSSLKIATALEVLQQEDRLFVILGHTNGSVEIFRHPTVRPPLILQAHTAAVRALAQTYSDSSEQAIRLFSGGSDAVVFEWDLSLRESEVLEGLDPVRSFTAHTKAIVTLAVSHETLLSASEDGTVRLWDMRDHTSPLRHSLLPPRSSCSPGAVPACLTFSSEQDTVLAGYSSGGLVAYALGDGRTLRASATDEGTGVTALVAIRSADGGSGLLVGCRDGSVTLRDVRSFRAIRSMPSHDSSIAKLYAVDDATYISASCDGVFKVVQLASGSCRTHVKPQAALNLPTKEERRVCLRDFRPILSPGARMSSAETMVSAQTLICAGDETIVSFHELGAD